MDGGKMITCPICMKGKYKEHALIQHLIDKHPEFPGTQKIKSAFQFPIGCPLCNAKIPTAIALMTHYSIYHLNEFTQLKSQFGFNFANSDTISSDQPLQILPNFDSIPVHFISTKPDMYEIIHPLVRKSPILFASLQSAQFLVIGSNNAICLVDSSSPRLGEYIEQYINKKVPVISLNNPTETKALNEKNINISTNINSNPFSCQEYIEFIRQFGSPPTRMPNSHLDINNPPSKNDLKSILSNFALAYYFLQKVGFFPQNKSEKQPNQSIFVCPICSITAPDNESLYRHLFRMHVITATVMNQYILPDQPKGVFICEKCHNRNIDSFDKLITHVFNEHREELLIKVRQQLRNKIEESRTHPQLSQFIQKELSIIHSAKQT